MSRRVEKDSSLGRYLSEIGAYSILTKEQEMEIARLVEEGGNRESLNRLVESNLSFVVKIANEYRNLGLAFEDLLNEGNIGLIEAARRYDHTKGTKFITYAIWWVRKSILKALSEQSNLVRVPSYQMKKVKRIREAEALTRLGLILATATLYLVSTGVSVVTLGLRRVVDTHWQRGLSYFQLGWRWLDHALAQARFLLRFPWLDPEPDPAPVSASKTQDARPRVMVYAISLLT